MVGQGKIDSIISAKNEDRRELFEEAAGISRFRHKRKDAERRLEQAQENLVRLLDILGELESRVGPLKTQSEKAKKFLEFSDEKKTLEALNAQGEESIKKVTENQKSIQQIYTDGIKARGYLNDEEKALAQAAADLNLAGSASDKLAQLFALSSVIDKFFDNTMVMVDNEAVKNNRLAILAELTAKASSVAAFNKLNTK